MGGLFCVVINDNIVRHTVWQSGFKYAVTDSYT